MHHRKCWVIVILSIIFVLPPLQANGQGGPLPPRSESPHWQHINILDFGRALLYITSPQVQATAYEWFTRHVDAAEAHGNAGSFKKNNATIKLFEYRLDLSMCQHQGCGWTERPEDLSLPEEYFLHFSEETELRFTGLDGKPIATIKVPGCPSSQAVHKKCRLQTFVWGDSRWVFNTMDSVFQRWKGTEFLRLIEENNSFAIFLDEHGPGFSEPMSWGRQAMALSGGGIREFGGKRPSTPDLEKAYNTAVAAWLSSLSSRFAASGKFVMLNTAGYSLLPMAVEQILAAKGVTTELMHRPDGWAGAYQYQEFIDLIKRLTAGGGIADLYGSPCYAGPQGYSQGNYRSGPDRYRMWRLASYYLVKERVGSTGRVYFNPTLCMSFNQGQELEFMKEWLPAYQVDVGQPVGDSYVHQQGTAGIASSDGRHCPYQIFGRAYTNALMLVRPKDFWDCTDFGDGSSAPVTLPKAMRLLKGDGSLGSPSTTVPIRNAEAVILMP
jgi:hypothetical protein